MSEQMGEYLGPLTKHDTVVGDAVKIAKDHDTAKAVAHIIESTEPTEERYAALAGFAKTLGPPVRTRTKHERRQASIERKRMHDRALKIGVRSIDATFSTDS